MKKVRETPLCDKWAYQNIPCNSIEPFVSVRVAMEKVLDFARELEREIIHLNKELEKVKNESTTR